MLRESSISTPRKFCCGTAARRISDGRIRQKTSSASSARRTATSTGDARGCLSLRMPRYVIRLAAAIAARATSASIAVRDAANVKSPCRKTKAGYLNRRLNSQLISARLAAFYPELHAGKHSPGRCDFNRSDDRTDPKVSPVNRGGLGPGFVEAAAEFCVRHDGGFAEDDAAQEPVARTRLRCRSRHGRGRR